MKAVREAVNRNIIYMESVLVTSKKSIASLTSSELSNRQVHVFFELKTRCVSFITKIELMFFLDIHKIILYLPIQLICRSS